MKQAEETSYLEAPREIRVPASWGGKKEVNEGSTEIEKGWGGRENWGMEIMEIMCAKVKVFSKLVLHSPEVRSLILKSHCIPSLLKNCFSHSSFPKGTDPGFELYFTGTIFTKWY